MTDEDLKADIEEFLINRGCYDIKVYQIQNNWCVHWYGEDDTPLGYSARYLNDLELIILIRFKWNLLGS